MTRFLRTILTAMAALSAPVAASADEQTPATCANTVAPGGELIAWTAPTPLKATGTAEQIATATLPVGRAGAVTLVKTPEVIYPLRPEKPGGSVSYGGLVRLTIAQAGTYRIALGSGAWIDLVRDGKAIASVKHGHGPNCSGIRKMVDFPLESGDYVLQLAANGSPQIGVLVARLP